MLRGLRRDPLGFLSSLTRRYGDIVRLRFWLWDVYVVWQPDDVKHVLQDRHTIYSKENVDYRVLKRMLGEGLVTSEGDYRRPPASRIRPARHRGGDASLPPAWIMTRVARDADEIGGYHVAPGTIVTLSPYLTHRSPEVWPDPERFDPDRFTDERSEGRPRFAYFPFAGGPRQCIGSEFALTEATLVVATIARRYRLELATRRKVVPQPLITLRPRGGLPMIPRAAGD